MQVTIDSVEPLERVLPVINALYGVSLALVDETGTSVSGKPTKSAGAAAPAGSQRGRSSKGTTRARATRRNNRTAVPAGVVREWARAHGHEVSNRGRIPGELMQAYRDAN